jgi:rubredoxin
MADMVFDGQMLDITAPTVVEVEVHSNGSVVWVNVDGVCAVRLCRIATLTINDKRPLAAGTLCHIHDVEEIPTSAEAYRCHECGHVYQSENAILKEFHRVFPGHGDVKDADDVACCPLCLHDW